VDLQLTGKRALVTGSSSGLGRQIALELAAEGVDVVVNGRDADRTEKTARDIEALGARAAIAIADLCTDEGADHAAAVANDRFGGVDILVNNTGVLLRKDNPAWDEVGIDEWIASFNVNFLAGLRMVHRLLPGMKQRGWGRIINVSSTSGSQPKGLSPEYGAPKASVDNFTVNLSKLVGPFGITVNSIVPGTIMTPAVEVWLETLKAQRGWGDDMDENEQRYVSEFVKQSIPRLGRPREISTAVAMLASPLQGYTNGATLRIDGGMAIHIGA